MLVGINTTKVDAYNDLRPSNRNSVCLYDIYIYIYMYIYIQIYIYI